MRDRREEAEIMPAPVPPCGVRIQVAGLSDRGRKRPDNEDRWLVADLTERCAWVHGPLPVHELGERGVLAVVADGMGGAAAGEVASDMAVHAIYARMVDGWSSHPDVTPAHFALRLREAVETANAVVYAHATAHPQLLGMGTTATAAGVLGDQIYVAQVGDSRAYLVREGRAHQLTKDQSLVQRLVESGDLGEDEAARSPQRNILLQSLGGDATVNVDLTRQVARAGDALILCSDGLFTEIGPDGIAEVVEREHDPARACRALVRLASDRGGCDNITVVLAMFDGGLLPPSPQDSVGYQPSGALWSPPESTGSSTPGSSTPLRSWWFWPRRGRRSLVSLPR